MGRLTTHVLDTARGRPAAGLTIVLLDGNGRELRRTVTNGDGRTDAPLLAGADFAAGAYELRFHVGPYFAADATRGDGASSDATAPGPDAEAFLDVVPVRFVVADAEAHYHVPLLVAPFGYSTYRGS